MINAFCIPFEPLKIAHIIKELLSMKSKFISIADLSDHFYKNGIEIGFPFEYLDKMKDYGWNKINPLSYSLTGGELFLISFTDPIKLNSEKNKDSSDFKIYTSSHVKDGISLAMLKAAYKPNQISIFDVCETLKDVTGDVVRISDYYIRNQKEYGWDYETLIKYCIKFTDHGICILLPKPKRILKKEEEDLAKNNQLNLKHLVGRMATDQKLMKIYPENKELLEKSMDKTKEAIVQCVIQNQDNPLLEKIGMKM